MGQLPQDEKDADPRTDAPAMRDHEAMSNFEKDRSDSYDNGFNNATKWQGGLVILFWGMY